MVARTDLRQLYQSPDFWVPMVVLAGFFFVVAPAGLLWGVTHISGNDLVQKVGSTLSVLPGSARSAINQRAPHASPAVKASYALAVYLFAPLAVIVPMTISTAVGANCLVGERERGTGEFLSHSPATERELYIGKLIASLVPGYLTTLVGFAIYSLVVNLIVGPHVGGWFFPTAQWWLLMFWVVPPFLAITLSVVLRLSARRQERGRGPTGVGARHPPRDPAVVRAVEWGAVQPRDRQRLGRSGGVDPGVRRAPARGPRRHPGPPARRRR